MLVVAVKVKVLHVEEINFQFLPFSLLFKFLQGF